MTETMPNFFPKFQEAISREGRIHRQVATRSAGLMSSSSSTRSGGSSSGRNPALSGPTSPGSDDLREGESNKKAKASSPSKAATAEKNAQKERREEELDEEERSKALRAAAEWEALQLYHPPLVLTPELALQVCVKLKAEAGWSS